MIACRCDNCGQIIELKKDVHRINVNDSTCSKVFRSIKLPNLCSICADKIMNILASVIDDMGID